MSIDIDRRSFLKAIGLGATGGMFGLPSFAAAQGAPLGERPLRVIQVFSKWGLEADALRMAPLGQESWLDASNWHRDNRTVPDPRTWTIDLATRAREDWSSALRPFYDLRRKLLYIDGLAQSSAQADPLGDAHGKSHAATATGLPGAYELPQNRNRTWASGPSVLWRIAQHMRQQDAGLTDLVKLNIEIDRSYQDTASGGGVLHFFWGRDSAGNIIQEEAERDPRSTFDSLFAGRDLGADPDVARAQALRMQLLDAADARYRSIAAGLGRDDAARLELHRSVLADLRARLNQEPQTECRTPDRFERRGPNRQVPAAQRYQDNIDAYVDLIAHSFMCDTTRVVGLELPDPPYDVIGVDGNPGLYHLVYSHGAAPERAFRREDRPSAYEEWQRAYPTHVRKTEHQAEIVAQLAKRLDAIPEGDGTMLDHTIIMWTDEIAHGGHQFDMYPMPIVGGGKVLSTGRYVKMPRIYPRPNAGQGWAAREIIGAPVTRVFTSVCQAMGMEIDGFSDDYGYSAELNGQTHHISYGGRLEELFG